MFTDIILRIFEDSYANFLFIPKYMILLTFVKFVNE